VSKSPTIALDTNVLNRLVKDIDPEPFIAAILSGYAVCLPEMSFEEILATRDPELRSKLINT
jgi:rRNA-processing protein FCF1